MNEYFMRRALQMAENVGDELARPVDERQIPITHLPCDGENRPFDAWLRFDERVEPRKLAWSSLDVSCTGEVSKTREGLKFTKFRLDAVLSIGADADESQARALLESAKKHCLVTASLNAETELSAEIRKT